MKKSLSLLMILSLVLFVSCSKDDDNKAGEFDGSQDSVAEFLGADLLETLLDLGLIINTGNTPPNIAGEFLMAPVILQKSNVQGDYPGMSFPDYQMKFMNQIGLNVDFSGFHTTGVQRDIGDGSFISGSGKGFTVFLITETDISGYKADTAMVISGTMTEDGIKDVQFALFMKDNHGNPGGVFIDNQKGRIIIDGDGLCEKI
ncbi:hypothetical protein EI546_11330 [Aequorivita sp. H23M31]|uniref:DUF4251 domain-containing protein n=1 Tax=Aequorivita ciconiae TaxID=2494375 RepID=A0A410G4S2_9FLAO|nr:hypothetical protein [Aequorivita sp. H23M31]QAA82274.1 hypothetical protein EI546_11330 [Aequorivita sp. H23M31]